MSGHERTRRLDLTCASFLDRVNIGQAAVAGLRTDLGIAKGNAYQIALSVFFIGYEWHINVDDRALTRTDTLW